MAIEKVFKLNDSGKWYGTSGKEYSKSEVEKVGPSMWTKDPCFPVDRIEVEKVED